MDPTQRYHLLGRLLEEMPDMPESGTITKEAALWLGKVGALVNEVGDGQDRARWGIAISSLSSTLNRGHALLEIPLVAYSALGKAEMKAPASAHGTFIPAGGQFDAFAKLSKIAAEATSDVLIVDPYLDATALTDFGTIVPEGVPLRLLADRTSYAATLTPAAQRWAAQYGLKRPLEVRLAPARTLHDRAIFIDRRDAWTLTQSLKDFAKRAHGEIVNTRDTAGLKIAAYEDVWSRSDPA